MYKYTNSGNGQGHIQFVYRISSSLNLLLSPRRRSPSTHLAPTLLPLHSTAHAHLLIPDELPNDIHPALMPGQILIELLGNLIHGRQPTPRHGREIMVLIVQPHVPGEKVQRAVVRVRLRHRRLELGARIARLARQVREDVVLGDEVAGEGVQTSREEAGEDEVQQGVSASVLDEGDVKGDLHDDVEEVQVRQRDLVDHHWAQGVEEDLEGAEEALAEDGVEEDGFEGGGHVGVEAVDAEGLVVREVVGAEGGGVGDADGDVGEDGEEAVGQGGAEGEVVADFVDGQEAVLVCRRADDVGCEEELPGEKGGVA